MPAPFSKLALLAQLLALVLWPLSDLRAQAGKVDSGFNPTLGGASLRINVLAPLPNGEMIAGGYFTSASGATRYNVTRLNPDGSLETSFQAGANNMIDCLAVQSDGKILIGGSFTLVGSSTRNHIARLNYNGTVDTSFYVGGGLDASAYSIAIQSDGKILVAGAFQSFDGNPASRLLRLNSDGTFDGSFQASADNYPYCVAAQPDGSILVGGLFTSINGTAADHLARLDTTGAVDQAFAAKAWTDGPVYAAVVQPDGKIILGGNFTLADGVSAGCISRLDSNGSLDATFSAGTGASAALSSIALQTDGK